MSKKLSLRGPAGRIKALVEALLKDKWTSKSKEVKEMRYKVYVQRKYRGGLREAEKLGYVEVVEFGGHEQLKEMVEPDEVMDTEENETNDISD